MHQYGQAASQHSRIPILGLTMRGHCTVKCIMLSVASSRIHALLMVGTSANWLRTWASFCMSSGCILLDAAVAVHNDGDIAQRQSEMCEERRRCLHM